MDLALIKQHLIIDHDLDNAIIQIYESSAEAAISNYIQSDYDDNNKVHIQAKLLLIGTWYANRESAVQSISVKELPQGISFLLDSIKGVSI